MKEAAAHTPTQTRSIANNEASRKRTGGIALFAPAISLHPLQGDVIQAKLDIGLTYNALQQVNAFAGVDGLVQQDIVANSLVTVIDHHDPENMTRVYDRTDAVEKYTPIIDDDSANFKSIGPELLEYHINLITDHPDHLEFKDYGNNNLNQQGFNPQSISQGETGDCWFLATLGAMTVSDHWRQHLINSIHKVANSNDFEVQLFEEPEEDHDGSKLVRISGHLMQYHPGSGLARQLVYGQQRTFNPTAPDVAPNANAVVWPALFEKALATIWGSYEMLDDHTPDMAFKVLTGSDATVLTPRTANVDGQAWTAVRDAFNLGAAVTLTTAKNDDLPLLNQIANDVAGMGAAPLNLLHDHVYIMVQSFQNGNIRVRNPHGGMHPPNLTRDNVNMYFERIDYLVPPDEMNL